MQVAIATLLSYKKQALGLAFGKTNSVTSTY